MKVSMICAFIGISFITSAADYTTYIGDEFSYQVEAMTTDGAGNTYVMSGPNLVLTKLDPTGKRLFALLLSDGRSAAGGIAVDAAGNIYIAGGADSAFPLLNPLPNQGVPGMGGGFLMKLNPQGTVLFSTILGGNTTSLNGVAVAATGDVYVVGTTTGPPQLMGGPNTAAYWAKVTPAGDKILYQGGAYANLHACGAGSSCFLSGIQTYGVAIAVDPGGNAYIGGNTYGYGLQTTPNAFLTNGIGAFVTKLDSSGGTVYFTLLGSGAAPQVGSPYNLLSAVVADAAGNAYITGQTSDPNFPATPSAFLPTLHGLNGFIAKLNPTGTALVWATFLGGTGRDNAKTIAVDPAGSVWTSGTTTSPDFPTSSGFPNGQEFLVELSSSGSALSYSARYPSNTVATAITLDSAGIVHMAGSDGLIATMTPSLSQAPHIYGIANAAGGVLAGNITTGELISIYGLHFGTSAITGNFDSNEELPTALGGIQVTIFGQPAPLLYVSDTQINAIVPFSPNSVDTATSLVLTTDGASVSAVRLFVQPAIPEIFQTSAGIAAAINQDGTVNSSANPAKAGSYVSVWASGAGGNGDQLATAVTPNYFCNCAIQTLSGSLYMSYIGSAPGMPQAVTQVNFQVPPQTTRSVTFRLGVDGAESDPVSIFVNP